MLEHRPMGEVFINEDGYIEFVNPNDKKSPKRSKVFKDTPEGQRFIRRCEMDKRKRKIERLKAGLPSEPPKPKPLTRQEKLDQHYRSLEVLNEWIPKMERGSRAYRIMVRSAKGSLDVIKALESGREPETRRGPIEEQMRR